MPVLAVAVMVLGASADFAWGATVNYTDGEDNSTPITLTTDDTLNVDSGTATQSGVISESGGHYGIDKTGAGTLYLTGHNTYIGDTTVSEGTLSVNGWVTSNVIIGSGATLNGTGTIQNNITVGSGTLAPGNSIGTLTTLNIFQHQHVRGGSRCVGQHRPHQR